jgi:hypothetical protein
MRLSIFAYHISLLMIEPAPARLVLSPCDGIRAEVQITPSRLGEAIWDQVTINGTHCGNRHGAVQHFTAMVAKCQPTVVMN